MRFARIRVCATTANLGPGFDFLGLAVKLYNEVTVAWPIGEAGPPPCVEITGEGATEIHDANNLMLTAFRHGLEVLGHPFPRVRIRAHNAIPVTRGLGSSAAAVVAGLAAASAVAGHEAPRRDWILEQALRIEPHPDNLAAAIHGGLTASVKTEHDGTRCFPMPLHAQLRLGFAVPDLRVSTDEARRALPADYRREDAVYSAARAAILVSALRDGAFEWLEEAVSDRLHTPFRAPLLHCWDDVRAAARASGACGVFISGSGPTVGAFVRDDARGVAQAMTRAFLQNGYDARPLALDVEPHGVTCTITETPNEACNR